MTRCSHVASVVPRPAPASHRKRWSLVSFVDAMRGLTANVPFETGNFQSEDDVLLAARQSLEIVQDDWAAVREALGSLERGEKGLSLEEAFEAVRRKHSIPADA